jgi:hypothetical protein
LNLDACAYPAFAGKFSEDEAGNGPEAATTRRYYELVVWSMVMFFNSPIEVEQTQIGIWPVS